MFKRAKKEAPRCLARTLSRGLVEEDVCSSVWADYGPDIKRWLLECVIGVKAKETRTHSFEIAHEL